ncbi:hypothetical protein Syun_010828 [Stephania yunnanensis]|uniref:VPS28 C-terminal domain-containing protein n=1 Tax=Stephania yunnanensis TaxID=152371 RepID=A0AAP0KJC5_9MAGN
MRLHRQESPNQYREMVILWGPLIMDRPSSADLYAIIKATEKLEKAYVRDVVSSSDYESESLTLGPLPDRRFCRHLQDGSPCRPQPPCRAPECPPRWSIGSAAAASATTSAATVAECVQHFITAMDTLKLNMVAVDQVHPVLADLLASLNKLTILPGEFEGRVKMREWDRDMVVAQMGAVDESSTDQQAKSFISDLESCPIIPFKAALPNAGS